ncbi:unnamed protein product, partial [Acidithrix sp. C25]
VLELAIRSSPNYVAPTVVIIEPRLLQEIDGALLIASVGQVARTSKPLTPRKGPFCISERMVSYLAFSKSDSDEIPISDRRVYRF